MKKFRLHIQLFIIVILVFGGLLPLMVPESVYAVGPPDKIVEKEWLNPGEARVNQHTKIKKIGTEVIDGQLCYQYEAEISSLPQTLPDLETKITIEWRHGQADDGVSFWETGNNVYWARVTGTRVSVEYENKLAAWDPDIYVGDLQLELKKGPTLAKDYLGNENYHRPNCIEWVYEAPKSLWQKLFGGKPFQITRIVRQIEGLLQEFYVIEEPPEGNLKIVNNYVSEEGFVWNRPIYAHDSRGIPLEVQGTKFEKSIDVREFGRPELTYPIIVDPTDSFSGSSYDGGYSMWGTTYNEAWNGSGSGLDLTGSSNLFVGQGNDYHVARSFVFFDTSSLPDSAIISYAQLKLYGQHDSSDTDFNVQIQSGMPTYPHRPPVESDFADSHYSGNGGTFGTSGWSLSGYNTIYLSSTGENWINKTGWTKFCLRSSRDISQTTPTGQEDIGFYAYEKGSGYQPLLYVTYTEPITKPSVSTWAAQDVTSSSAKLRGYLSNDGGTDCSLRFLYGTTDEYGSSTPFEGPYSSGDSYFKTVYGLSEPANPGTIYHYTLQADNGEYLSDDDDEIFLTKPLKPTNFSVTPGEGENVLSWNLGTGSGRTLIRRSTIGYPNVAQRGDTGTSVEIYFDTGTGTTDTDVENGVTYYYSAWGEITSGSLQQYSEDYAKDDGKPETTGPPVVRTDDPTEVTQTTAQFNGYLESMEGADSVDVYFYYKKDLLPRILVVWMLTQLT